MGLTLQRHLGPPTTMEPGQFTRATGATIIACPLCDGLSTISETHAIDSSGRVTPAFACPTCPFLEFLVLESHGEEVVT